MNTDMSRNTPHALAMRQFLSDFNYTACIDTPISEVPYTYVSALGSSSRIDHFIVTSALSDNLLECSIVTFYSRTM